MADDNRQDGSIVLGLDFKASFALIQQQLNQIAQRLKLRITGQLDTSATKKQLESDLKGVNVKESVKIGAKIDKNAVKRQLKEDLKELDGTAEVKINARIEGADVLKQLQDQRVDIDINADAAPLEDVGNGLDSVNKKSAATVASVYLLHRALSELQRAAEQMVVTAIDLDRQLTELRMVTGGSYDEAARMIDSYNALARELGATTKQAAEAANEWLRQGKTVAETEELITQSMILSKVGAMTAAEATQRLTSAMKGYGLEVESVSGIVDKLTAIDLQAAVTSSDLAEAMSRTAASANIAGVSMDKLLGYLTIMQEVTQKSATEIGTSMRSIFARLQNVKLGKFIDDETGEALNDTEKVLKEFGIALRDANGNFRDMGAALDEVGAKWNTFTALEKSAIATAAAGTRQRENFLVLMENYGKALEYAGVAADSAGTAMSKFEAYQESIEAHMNTLTASAEALAKETIPAEFVNGLLDASSAVLDFVTNTRLLSIALNTLGAAMTVKGLTALTGQVRKAYSSVAALSEAFAILQRSANVSMNTEEFTRLIAVTKSLNQSQLALVLSNKQLSQEQRIAILTSRGMTEQEAQQTLVTMGLATAEGAATGATLSLSGAFKALGAAIASNPIGFIATALTMTISVITTFEQKAEEARGRLIDTAKSAGEASKRLGDLAGEYLTLTAALDDNETETEALISARNSLIDALGLEQGEVDKLVQKYGNLTEAMRQAALQELNRQGLDLSAGVDAARTQLLKDARGDWTGQSINNADIAWNGANRDDNNRALGVIRGMGYLANAENVMRTRRISLTTDGYDTSTVDGTIAAYERLEEVLTAIREEVGADNDVYRALYGQYEQLTEAVTAYRDTVSASNENIVQTAMLEQLHGRSLAKTQSEFDEYRQSVIDAVAADQNYIGSAEDIAAAVDDVLSRESSFADFYGKVKTAATQAAEATDTLTNNIKALSDASDLLAQLDAISKKLTELDGDELPLDMLVEIIDLIPEAAGEINTVAEAQELLRGKIQQTEQAAIDAYAQMLISNNSFISGAINGNERLKNALIGYYGEDQTRFQKLADGKLKIEQALISDLSGLWAKYSKYTTDELEKQLYYMNYLDPSPNMDRINELQSIISLRRALESNLTGLVNGRTSATTTASAKSKTTQKSEFEKLYEYHQHLLAMDQESVEDYIAWLDGAYQAAYKKGEIDLDKYYKYQEEVFTKIKSLLDSVRKSHENAISLTQNWLDQAIDAKDFDKIREYTRAIVSHYRQMQESVHKQADYYRSLGYDETSDEISRLSAMWWDYYDSIKDASANAWARIVSNANDALDTVQGVYNTMRNAAQEYAENGYITIDTLQEITKWGAEYLAYLANENGHLVINEDSIQRVIAARTEQMAVETALQYVEQVRNALDEGNIDTLNRLVFATDAATKSTWDLVYAQIEALNLTDDQYKAVMQRITALQSLTNTALHGIGKVSGAARKEIEDTKDALDSILKYVEDMIKQEVDNQVDALEGQIDAYKQIIDLQKQSLDLERKRDDYTRSVEDKTAQLAELQAQIALLDQDNSREAQAQKVKLAQQMSEIQRDLSDIQADYAYDTTIDALDNMADAYEKSKKDEIETLKDTVSSEERLYRAAIQRIDQGWSTLYDDLMSWSYRYGNVTQSEITSAWAAASQAVQQYGSYLDAVAQTQNRIASFDAGSFNTVGTVSGNATNRANTQSTVKGLVSQVKQNSADWFKDGADKKNLEQSNERLASEISALLGRDVVKDNGTWYIDSKAGRKLYSVYHKGGIVGDDPTLRQNELFAKLKKGEMVLTERQQEGMYRMLAAQETLLARFGKVYNDAAGSDMATAKMQEQIQRDAKTVRNVTNNQHNVNVVVNAPIQTVQKLDEREIKQLSRRIGNDTIATINESYYKRGKRLIRTPLKPD